MDRYSLPFSKCFGISPAITKTSTNSAYPNEQTLNIA